MFSGSNGSLPRLSKQVFLFFFSTFIILLQPLSVYAYEIIIGTGQNGTFSHYTARVLCRMLEKKDSDIVCTLNSSDDEVDSLTNVQGGSLDMALIDSHLLLQSMEKKGPFSFLDISYDRIRGIVPLYDIPVTLVVRRDAGISVSSELAGKRVNTGPPGSPEKQIFEMFMQASGWTEEDFAVFGELSDSLAQDKIAFRQGHVQVLVHWGVHPDPDVNQLVNDSGAQLIGINGETVTAMITRTPSLSYQKVSRKAYPFLSADLDTFATTMTLVTSADMDDETAHLVTSVLVEKEEILQALHPSLYSFHITPQEEWFGGLKVHKAVLVQLGK